MRSIAILLLAAALAVPAHGAASDAANDAAAAPPELERIVAKADAAIAALSSPTAAQVGRIRAQEAKDLQRLHEAALKKGDAAGAEIVLSRLEALGGELPAAGGGGAAGASAALGAPGFQPTPQRPVGWRGDGTGRYPGATPPTSWGRAQSGAGYQTKGILWATPLPNIGVSSPLVVGARVFVTAEPADVVCIDKQSGRILWIRSHPACAGATEEERKVPEYAEKLVPLMQKLDQADNDLAEALNAIQPAAATSASHEVPAATRKRALEKEMLGAWVALQKKKDEYGLYGAQNVFGYCGPTPASDGRHVYAFCATGISACYDLEGRRSWIAVGHGGGAEHGNFASPVLAGSQFIVWANELRGYDAASGKLLWSNPCQPRNTYGSPFVLHCGSDLVVGSQNGRFTRVSDGKPIWNNGAGFTFDDAVPTPIVENGVIFAHGGYKDEVGFKAYRIPASIDGGGLAPSFVFKSEWDADFSDKDFRHSYTASPLCVDGLVYRLSQGGGLIVNRAADGDLVYRKVLAMRSHTAYWNWAGASASPTLAGKYIYLMDNQGTAIVIQAGAQYQEVAVNQIEEANDGKGQVQNLATPTFDGRRMYHRTPGFLYCIGDK